MLGLPVREAYPEKRAPTGELWMQIGGDRRDRLMQPQNEPLGQIKYANLRKIARSSVVKCRCLPDQNGLTTTRSTMPISASVGSSLTPRKNRVECVLWSAAKAACQRASRPWKTVNPATR